MLQQVSETIIAPQEVSELVAEEIKENKIEKAVIDEIKAPLKEEI